MQALAIYRGWIVTAEPQDDGTLSVSLNARMLGEAYGNAQELVDTFNRNAQALRAIHAAMDGREWSADVLDDVARALAGAGFSIREPE